MDIEFVLFFLEEKGELINNMKRREKVESRQKL